MKTLKTLPVENLKGKMNKFEELLSSNPLVVQRTNSSPVFL